MPLFKLMQTTYDEEFGVKEVTYCCKTFESKEAGEAWIANSCNTDLFLEEVYDGIA